MRTKIVPEYNEAWNDRIHQIVEGGEELEGVIRDGLKCRTESDFRSIYTIGLALQCLSHFRAGRLLVRSGFGEEVWILIRCIAEHIIKIKQTPSLPDAGPRSDRFRCGGRKSKFLAETVLLERFIG